MNSQEKKEFIKKDTLRTKKDSDESKPIAINKCIIIFEAYFVRLLPRSFT